MSTSERMQLAREAVISLLELSESELNIGITSVEENGSSVTYTVQAAAGSTLTVPENSGIVLSGGNGVWQLTLNTTDVSELAFTVTKDSVSESFALTEGKNFPRAFRRAAALSRKRWLMQRPRALPARKGSL